MGWFGAHRTRTWFHGSANAPKLSAMGSSSTLLRREGARTWSSHTDAGIRPFRFALWSNERTRTTGLLQLRVIHHPLQGCAGDCKCRIFRGVSFPCLAACCTVLRSRWYQSGSNTGAYLLHHAACERYACEVRLAPRPARQHPANPRPLLSLDAVYGRSTADVMDEVWGEATYSCP